MEAIKLKGDCKLQASKIQAARSGAGAVSKALATAAAIELLLMSQSALAFSAGGGFLAGLQGWLMGIAVTVFTIAIMFCGFKVLFQGASMREVMPIFIGGILFGGAPAIAALVLS